MTPTEYLEAIAEYDDPSDINADGRADIKADIKADGKVTSGSAIGVANTNGSKKKLKVVTESGEPSKKVVLNPLVAELVMAGENRYLVAKNGKPGHSKGGVKTVKVTDREILDAMEEGLSIQAMCRKFGVNYNSIWKRVKKLRINAGGALLAGGQSQKFIQHNIDVIARLSESMDKVIKLQSACDEWLTDPNNPEKYDIGPRSNELAVICELKGGAGKSKKVKKTLSELVDLVENGLNVQVINVENKSADPRELILATVREARQVISAMTDLARMVAEVNSMQDFKDAMIQAIRDADVETAEKVIQSIQSSGVLPGSIGVSAGIALREAPG